MSELFRSAFNYFTPSSLSSSTPLIGTVDHPLVGTNVEVGALRLRIRSMIAEGGYALVFSAQDSHGNWYALKRQLAADRQAAEAVLQEIRFLRELSGHRSILRYAQAAQLSPQESGHGRAEFLLLTELCPGSVIDLLQKEPLTVSQVMKIFYASCSAVHRMHTRKPPITHRDIKVENLLFDASGHVKLCDFGSATTEIFLPDDTWTALQRSRLEEELLRHTTPMYRAPELVDIYSNYPVGPAQDIWALGCILYYLCYSKHPFEDSAKLRIINANYVLGDCDSSLRVFHPLIKSTLQVDPRQRPSIDTLCKQLEAIADAIHVDLNQCVEGLSLPQLCSGETTSRSVADENSQKYASKISPAPHRRTEQEQTTQQQASAVLGAIKGQGMSWFKNIRDKTSAVAQTVQSTYGARGPDVTFITSRLVIAPLADGIPEALAFSAEEAMRSYIIDQSCGQFAIYNLSSRRLRCDYKNCQSETPLPASNTGLTPPLEFVVKICSNMALYLNQKAKNFVVITGSETQCVLVAASFLLYVRLVPRPLTALELICTKRQAVALPASYHRLLDLVTMVVSTDHAKLLEMAHNRPIILKKLKISPIPLFNRSRTGCRPYVEIHCGGCKIRSTFKTYEDLRVFETLESSVVEITLGDVLVGDDVQVVVYHARWIKMQNRMQPIFIFSMGFHANFIDRGTRVLKFNRGDLDILSDDELKFGEPLRVELDVKISEQEKGFSTIDPPVFLVNQHDNISPTCLLSGGEEYESIIRKLGLKDFEQKKQSCESSSNIGNTIDRAAEIKYNKIAQRDDHFHGIVNNDVIDEKHMLKSQNAEAEHLFKDRDDAEIHERMSGIRVSSVVENDDHDDEQYKFDCDKLPKVTEDLIEVPHSPLNSQPEFVDLLGLGTECDVPCSSTVTESDLAKQHNINEFTFFESAESTKNGFDQASNANGLNDLLCDIEEQKPFEKLTTGQHGMQRHVSAPSFMEATSERTFDPFADFLSSANNHSLQKGTRIESASVISSTATLNAQRPNYNRAYFNNINSNGGVRPKVEKNAFNDLLSSHGFSTCAKNSVSLGEMKRNEEIHDLGPIAIKIRDWTKGKEKNIRALLGSLDDVLWPDADKWVQPGIADLLTAVEVKKCYRRACLVIHPDKQVGTENEELARAIFTELNDAWTAFENSGSQPI